jgi:hypothetical protein
MRRFAPNLMQNDGGTQIERPAIVSLAEGPIEHGTSRLAAEVNSASRMSAQNHLGRFREL